MTSPRRGSAISRCRPVARVQDAHPAGHLATRADRQPATVVAPGEVGDERASESIVGGQRPRTRTGAPRPATDRRQMPRSARVLGPRAPRTARRPSGLMVARRMTAVGRRDRPGAGAARRRPATGARRARRPCRRGPCHRTVPPRTTRRPRRSTGAGPAPPVPSVIRAPTRSPSRSTGSSRYQAVAPARSAAGGATGGPAQRRRRPRPPGRARASSPRPGPARPGSRSRDRLDGSIVTPPSGADLLRRMARGGRRARRAS